MYTPSIHKKNNNEFINRPQVWGTGYALSVCEGKISTQIRMTGILPTESKFWKSDQEVHLNRAVCGSSRMEISPVTIGGEGVGVALQGQACR